MLINSKRYLLDRIEQFTKKGCIISHIDEVNFSTVNDKLYMTYEIFFKHPVQAIEFKINMIGAKSPHLINSLFRYHIHPLVRKYSHMKK